MTHRAVAARAGVPLGSTTYYFTDRDELLTAAIERARAVDVTRARTAAADTGTAMDPDAGPDAGRAMDPDGGAATRRSADTGTATDDDPDAGPGTGPAAGASPEAGRATDPDGGTGRAAGPGTGPDAGASAGAGNGAGADAAAGRRSLARRLVDVVVGHGRLADPDRVTAHYQRFLASALTAAGHASVRDWNRDLRDAVAAALARHGRTAASADVVLALVDGCVLAWLVEEAHDAGTAALEGRVHDGLGHLGI